MNGVLSFISGLDGGQTIYMISLLVWPIKAAAVYFGSKLILFKVIGWRTRHERKISLAILLVWLLILTVFKEEFVWLNNFLIDKIKEGWQTINDLANT